MDRRGVPIPSPTPALLGPGRGLTYTGRLVAITGQVRDRRPPLPGGQATVGVPFPTRPVPIPVAPVKLATRRLAPRVKVRLLTGRVEARRRKAAAMADGKVTSPVGLADGDTTLRPLVVVDTGVPVGATRPVRLGCPPALEVGLAGHGTLEGPPDTSRETTLAVETAS